MNKKYNFGEIESKWQKKWLEEKIYEPDLKGAARPFYNLMMFPYPSAEGLHVGNMYAFTGSDIYGRVKRMQGHDVFEPIGLDGFGIHSENYALKIGAHPMEQAKVSEKRFYEQLAAIGNGFAWNERLETYDPEYYKWTQWIFTQLFKKGLAYRKKQPVNWCPSCKTVLADEQVVGGKCERCGTVVVKKDLEQWFFKITAYAEKLLQNLEKLDWSERVKIAQRNWIGRSEGALLKFTISDSQFSVDAFTTRPDTLFGATYMVLAPEHPLIENLGFRIENLEEVRKYVKKACAKTDEERIADGKEKTGVELKGVKAVNPANNEEIPVWVADYVLGNVGTGAIMAVPAHDGRDFEFAKKYRLPIREVVLQKFGQKKDNAIFRDSIAAVITRLSDGRILVLFNRKSGEYEIPGGGRESDESDLATLKREIAEETGYTDLEVKEYLGQTATNFFSVARKEERTKHQQGYHVVLSSEKSIPLKPDAHEDFQSNWMEPQEAIKKLDSNIHVSYESEFIKRFLDKKLICFTGDGELVNSGKFSGMDSEKAKWEITKFVNGKKETHYRLRDWLISRQRYWGPPIPMIYCEACAEEGKGEQVDPPAGGMPGWYAVPENELPVKLPYVKNFRPTGTGESPLASVKEFYEVECPGCGGQARRETDVSDTFLDSAWYYLRYLDAKNSGEIFDKNIVKKWLPAEMYIGGAEHAVLHLLYVRFIAMVFHDLGLVKFDEPFKKFSAHGILVSEGAKMSKSKGNVVNPDEYIKNFGADTLRMYLMFLAPFDQGGDFRDAGILGIERFLNRAWKLMSSRDAGGAPKAVLHRAIKKVTEDIELLHYNTAVSALMILLNNLEKSGVSKEEKETLVKLLAPFAPHMAEEIWRTVLGRETSVHKEKWPAWDEKFIKEEKFMLVVQVNGKVRDTFEAPAGISEKGAEKLALGREKVATFLNGRKPRRTIYIPGKIVNIVV